MAEELSRSLAGVVFPEEGGREVLYVRHRNEHDARGRDPPRTESCVLAR